MELGQPPPRLSFRQTQTKQGGQRTPQRVLGKPENVGAKDTPDPGVGEGQRLGVGERHCLDLGGRSKARLRIHGKGAQAPVTHGHPRAGLRPQHLPAAGRTRLMK